MFLASHPSMWTILRGLKKDMSIHRLTVMQAQIENNDAPKKYKTLAEKLCQKVNKYEEEQDKLKSLWAVAHIS